MKEPKMVAALILGALGCLFVLIGMATPGWLTSEFDVTIGLFTVCGGRGCASYSAEGAVAAAKAFVVIGFFCSLAAIIDGIVYYVKYIQKDIPQRLLPLVSAILYIVAAAVTLLGAIIFAAKGKDDIIAALGYTLTLSYSFALAIVGAILCGVAGALTLVHRQGQSG